MRKFLRVINRSSFGNHVLPWLQEGIVDRFLLQKFHPPIENFSVELGVIRNGLHRRAFRLTYFESGNHVVFALEEERLSVQVRRLIEEFLEIFLLSFELFACLVVGFNDRLVYLWIRL